MNVYRHIVLTAFAGYFAVLKCDECKTRVVHVCGNSQTVITQHVATALENRVDKIWEKKPKHTAILLRKLLLFLFSIYTAVYIGHALQYCLSMKIYFGSSNSKSCNFYWGKLFNYTYKVIIILCFNVRVRSFRTKSSRTRTFKLIFVL
jgi:hypothetical protein